MVKKKLTKILWYGSEKDANGNPIVPDISPNAERHLEGLNEGEIYIHNDDGKPSFFIRTNKGRVVAIGGSNIEELKKIFLRKDTNDRSSGMVSSDKGFEVGRYVSGVSGAIMFIDKITGKSVAEVDKLYVRMKAYFETLEIKNANSIGGKQIISPAGGVRLTDVAYGEYLYDGEGNLVLDENEEPIFVEYDGFVRCYFLAEQDGEKIGNRFKVSDQMYCQFFNAFEGEGNKISNKYYWRLLVATDNNTVIRNGKECYYFDLSKDICDTDSDMPEVGDVVCQRGSMDDVDRQNFLEFSSVDAFSPSITIFQGVGGKLVDGEWVADYSLIDKEMVQFAVNKSTGRAFMHLYGDMYVGDRLVTNEDGTTIEPKSYIRYTQENGLEVKGKISASSTIGDTNTTFGDFVTNIHGDIDNLQQQIDGAIESFFYEEEPTLENEPAKDWDTDDEKKAHLNDTFTNLKDGRSWRWSVKDGVYGWVEITDTATAEALRLAGLAKDTADGKRRVFTKQPTPPYDEGDLWSRGKDYSLKICVNSKPEGGLFEQSDWDDADNVNKVKEELEKAKEELDQAIKDNAEDLNKLNQSLNDTKTYIDGAFADGIITETEKVAIEKYIKQIETVKAETDASYEEVYGNELLLETSESGTTADSTVKIQLKSAYETLCASIVDLITTIQSVILDDKATSDEIASVDFKYDTFNSKYGDYIKCLNAAINYIELKLNSKISQNIADLGGYAYLKEALKDGAKTEINGGLVQSTLLALGEYSDDGKSFTVWSGTSGIYDETKIGNGIAAWYGGGNIDLFQYYDSTNKVFNVPDGVRAAMGVDRMDGTGYRANGNLWWDENGVVHADTLSFFVGESTVGGLLASFQVVLQADGVHPQYLIPQVPFQSLNVTNDFKLGSGDNHALLKYDAEHNAVYVVKQDGSPVNFYSTGGISMYGLGDTSVTSLMDAIVNNLDPATLTVKNGMITVIGNTGSEGVSESVVRSIIESYGYIDDAELLAKDYADKDWVKEYVVDINTGNITAITKQMVIEALGYTPYSAANPNGYITSATLVGYATKNDLDGYLPLSGGTIASETYGKLNVKRNSSVGHSGITFSNSTEVLGIIGVGGSASSSYAYKPMFVDKDSNPFILLHTGNYTSYTYSQSTIDSKLGGYLPLTGGTVNGGLNLKGGFDTKLTFTNTDGEKYFIIQFNENTEKIGQIRLATDGLHFINNISAGFTFNGNTIWHAGNDGAGSGLDAGYLGGNRFDTFATYSAGSNYLAFNIPNTDLQAKGKGDGYIEYYDNGGWYNSKWGKVTARDGFVGNLTGNATSADYATNAGNADTLDGLDSTDFALVSDLENYVTLNTTQTIVGAKTLAANIEFRKPALSQWEFSTIYGHSDTDSGYRVIRFINPSKDDKAAIHWFYNTFNSVAHASNNINIQCTDGYITLGEWARPVLTVSQITNKVGIGTTNPTLGLLHIEGDAYANHFRLYGGHYIYWNGDKDNYSITCQGSGVMDYKAWYGHNFYSRGVNVLSILERGNVGIGTTTPAYKLDVNGTTRTNGLVFYNTNAISFDAYGNIVLNEVSTTNYWHIFGDKAGDVISIYGGTSPKLKIDAQTRMSKGVLFTNIGDGLYNVGCINTDTTNGLYYEAPLSTDSSSGTPTKHWFGWRGNKEGMVLDGNKNLLVHGNITSNAKVIVNGISLSKSQDDVLYLDGNLVVRGAITMYGTDSTTAPSIIDSLPIASTSSKGIAQFSGDFFTVSDGVVRILDGSVGLNETKLASYLTSNGYTTTTAVDTKLSGYLPLSGGTLTDRITISSSADEKIVLNNTDADTNYSWISWQQNGALIGRLGIPIGGTGLTWNNYQLIHAGNIANQSVANATNADTLDGVHYQNILEKTYSGNLRFKTTGWYRIGVTKNNNATGNAFTLYLFRVFNNAPSEAHIINVTYTHGNTYSFTQVAGSGMYHLIKKIRIDAISGTNVGYIDIYYKSNSANEVRWFTVGNAESYTTATQVTELTGTALEFDTAFGCKSSNGFTGDLIGNSTTSTKLQTARTIWGQSFDGTGDVSGNLHLSNNAITDLSSNRILLCDSSSLYFGTVDAVVYNTYITGKSIALRYGSSAVVGFLINSSGNVGIGTQNPAYKLDVNGTLNATTIYQNGTALGSMALKSSLVASDIPSLDWSKITSGKPTTLNGYGITNAYTASEVDTKLSSYLPLTGGTIKGDIRLKTDNSNYGQTIYFGDQSYCYISEPSDDAMKIYASKGVTIDATLSVTGTITGNLNGNATKDGDGNVITSTYLKASSYTASDILTKLKTVDGANSGLDADYLGGTRFDYYASYSAGSTYLAFNIPNTELQAKGKGDGYIEYYDGGWYNSKWGKVTAVNGFVGALTGNADSATQLKNSRTIWGQSFNGTGNVSGAFSGATTGSFSSNVTIGGTLAVTGTSTFTGKTTHNGGLGATSGTFSSTLAVSSTSVLSGGVTVGKTTAANGTYKLNVTGKSLLSGDTTIDGNLLVKGGITMYGTDGSATDFLLDATSWSSVTSTSTTQVYTARATSLITNRLSLVNLSVTTLNNKIAAIKNALEGISSSSSASAIGAALNTLYNSL